MPRSYEPVESLPATLSATPNRRHLPCASLLSSHCPSLHSRSPGATPRHPPSASWRSACAPLQRLVLRQPLVRQLRPLSLRKQVLRRPSVRPSLPRLQLDLRRLHRRLPQHRHQRRHSRLRLRLLQQPPLRPLLRLLQLPPLRQHQRRPQPRRRHLLRLHVPQQPLGRASTALTQKPIFEVKPSA